MLISITDSAKQQLKILCEKNGKWGVKLAVKGGGCAGFTYDWRFLDNESQLEQLDEVIDLDSNKFVIDGVSVLYVSGTQLDYKTEIFGSNFVFSNPNATSKCGCGTSFAV